MFLIQQEGWRDKELHLPAGFRITTGDSIGVLPRISGTINLVHMMPEAKFPDLVSSGMSGQSLSRHPVFFLFLSLS